MALTKVGKEGVTGISNSSNATAITIDSSENVGIGVTDPSTWSLGTALHIGNKENNLWGEADYAIHMSQNAYYNSGWKYSHTDEATRYSQEDGQHIWSYAGSGSANAALTWSEAMRIDASGNVKIGTVGVLGIANGDNLFISSDDTNDVGVKFNGDGDRITPCDASGADRDNAIDLGEGSARFDDIFATNGTINTSDQNEKQQIASLTAAEITAAKAISALFKTFKWKDKVESKGDDARTHTGVIAQEVQTAMSNGGLDAADYAFWCSDTWTDDDGNSQTRMGIRYPELLAFVGAATEQRLANIETRLTALEDA